MVLPLETTRTAASARLRRNEPPAGRDIERAFSNRISSPPRSAEADNDAPLFSFWSFVIGAIVELRF